jgi:hypothetical protein
MDVIAASAAIQQFLQVGSWEGHIAAVFRHSFLCTAPDRRLIHLHSGPRLASPFSLRVKTQEVFAKMLQATPFVQGMPVWKMDRTMAITECVHFRLDRTTYYESPRHPSGAVEPAAIAHARQTLRLYGRVGGFDQLPAAHTIARTMSWALAHRDTAQILEATRQLIGLGRGLTPSGDDFLVGCLRGLWLMRHHVPGVDQMLDHVREALQPTIEARTTRVGAEFIRYALDGAFAEVLDQATLALLTPAHPQVLQSAITGLLAQGDTSGTDTLIGLLTCLDALLPMPKSEPCQVQQDEAITRAFSADVRG